jgi:hypothetical protein
MTFTRQDVDRINAKNRPVFAPAGKVQGPAKINAVASNRPNSCLSGQKAPELPAGAVCEHCGEIESIHPLRTPTRKMCRWLDKHGDFQFFSPKKGGDASAATIRPKQNVSRPAKAAPKSNPEGAADPDQEPPNAFIGPEKLLHRDFETDMHRRRVHVVHARTDRQSTIAAGLPDFHLMCSRRVYDNEDDRIGEEKCFACAVEFKTAGHNPSPKQREVIAEMRAKGVPVKVCWTLADAINFAREHLGC